MNHKLILVLIIVTLFFSVPGSSAPRRHMPPHFTRMYGNPIDPYIYDEPMDMIMEDISGNFFGEDLDTIDGLAEEGLDTINDITIEPDYLNDITEPVYYNPYIYVRSIPREFAPPIVFSTQPIEIIKSTNTAEIEEFMVHIPMTKASTISWIATNQENFNIWLITTTSLGVYRETINNQGRIYGNNTTKIYISSSHPFTVTIYSDIPQDDKTTVKTPTGVSPDDKIVYINNTDRLYHNEGCPFLRRSKSAILLENAIRANYKECYRCAR